MIEHEAPASVGQRMLWLIEHYRGGGQGQLNYPLLLRLQGALDPAALQAALDLLVARHEALRTTFARRRGLLTQLVHAAAPVAVHGVPAPQAELARLVDAEIATPIDPRSAPVRVTAWQLDGQEHLLCINAHHLVTDAWSCRLIVDELAAALDGRPLPAASWQYRHFVRWQRRKATAQRQEADRVYWSRQLEGAQAPELAGAAAGPAEPAPGNRTRQLDIAAAQWAALGRLARAEQTTPFTVLLSVYYALIHRESGGTDLAVASPFANRARPEVMGTVGFFANLLVLRTRLEPGGRFLDLLRQARVTVNEAHAHQAFAHFRPSSAAGAHEGGRSIENIIFQMLPGLPPPVRAGGLIIEVQPPRVASRFDLELSVLPRQEGLRALFQYDPRVFPDALAERLTGGCADLVAQLAAEGDSPL